LGYLKKVDTAIILLGMKRVLGDERVTDYGDILLSSQMENAKHTIDDIWGAICNYFRINGIISIYLDCIREDSQNADEFSKSKRIWSSYDNSFRKLPRIYFLWQHGKTI